MTASTPPPPAYLSHFTRPPDAYRHEVAQMIALFQRHRRSPGRSLLQVACGAAPRFAYLREHFDCLGVELSGEMLAAARQAYPGLPLLQASPLDFHLARAFDLVLSLEGSVAFACSRAGLKRALANMAAHLAPGGLLLLEPWIMREDFTEQIVADVLRQPGLRIARMDHLRRAAPDRVEIELHHLVGRGRVTYHTARLEVGLFSRDEYIDAVCAAGLDLLDAENEPNWLVARKPA